MRDSVSTQPACTGSIAPRPTAYSACDGAIIGGAYERFNNRPIYANNRDDVVIGGDRPIIRLGRHPFLFGSMVFGLTRGDTSLWLHEAEQVEMSYRAGRLTWEISDVLIPGLVVTLDVVPVVGATGMILRLRAQGGQPGDRFFYAFGGALSGINPNSAFDAAVSEQVRARAFVPADCQGNLVEIVDGGFAVTAPATEWPHGSGKSITGRAIGRSSTDWALSIADAQSWPHLRVSQPAEHPILLAETSLNASPIYWGVLGVREDEEPNTSIFDDLTDAFEIGWRRGEDLEQRCVVSSPEPRLNALAGVSAAAVDGTWYPPYFVHSAMLWNMPFPGWRTIFGGTMYGWRDRLKETARYFIDSQVKESTLTEPEADPEKLLTIQSEKSRYYGKGRITAHSGFYDMQSQFFDQLITEWRWRADAEYELILRPALDLHLEWMQECFDPEKTGTYESYINSWPTDSVWYNGGGSCEATSYAYRGHQVALEMAQRAGDTERESFHVGLLARIKKGFFDRLWIERLGHPGAYREQGGHQRLHEDPWLYGIFLPIDAGLLTPAQAATTLHYARTSLQNDHKPFGGRMVWNSNWLPAIWSTRVDWPGDNYALALAYFQAGFGDDGWDVFKGTFLSSAYDLACPGNLGHKAGGYDFGDCTHTFARTLVEGMFGFNPNYPHGVIRLRPQFPSDWKEAALHIPDASLMYLDKGDLIRYEVALATPAALEIAIPLRARIIKQVRLDDEPVAYEVRPGIHTSVVHVNVPTCRKAVIAILYTDAFAPLTPLELTGPIGEELTIAFPDGEIVEIIDHQSLFQQVEITEGKFSGVLTGSAGQHLVLAEVKMGAISVQRLIYLTVTDPAHGITDANAITVTEVPAHASWQPIDLASVLNADVRTIFQQEYLSPRPNTVSVRIGTDGWTPWTSTFWKHKPPVIALDQVSALVQADSTLRTPQGATFAWPGGARNIAFTSLWDNFPAFVTVPVNTSGDTVWLLIAGSTNPMQCNIANAIVRLRYADGTEQTLDLIPPKNFWALAPLQISGSEKGQEGRHDYSDPTDAFCVPQPYPDLVDLGSNCRAMLYGLRLKSDTVLQSVTLETLSQEVVIGLMGISVSTTPAKS